MTLIDLRKKVHQKVLQVRNFENLLACPALDELWDKSTDDTRKELERIVLSHDRIALQKWIQEHPTIDLGERSICELKQIARRYGITGWSRLTKRELIRELIYEKTRHAGSAQGNVG